jgi:predicted DNA-binding transcriptional regulator AlpA
MEDSMLHSAISGALPTGPASPLGLVDFEELGDLLRVSRPTLERLIRKDHTFPRLFRIGGKRYARFDDLRIWVEQLARAA